MILVVEILKAKDPELGSKFGQRLTVPDCTPVFTIIMKKLKSPGNPDTAVTPYEEALVEHYRAQDEATKRRTLLRVECIEAETAGCIRVAEDSNEYSQIHKRYCARKLEIAAEDLLTKQVGYKKVYDRKEKEDSTYSCMIVNEYDSINTRGTAAIQNV